MRSSHWRQPSGGGPAGSTEPWDAALTPMAFAWFIANPPTFRFPSNVLPPGSLPAAPRQKESLLQVPLKLTGCRSGDMLTWRPAASAVLTGGWRSVAVSYVGRGHRDTLTADVVLLARRQFQGEGSSSNPCFPIPASLDRIGGWTLQPIQLAD